MAASPAWPVEIPTMSWHLDHLPTCEDPCIITSGGKSLPTSLFILHLLAHRRWLCIHIANDNDFDKNC